MIDLSFEETAAVLAVLIDVLAEGRIGRGEIHKVFPVIGLHPSHAHDACQTILVDGGICEDYEEARAWMDRKFEERITNA